MADIATLQYNWRNFSADRGKAKRDLVLEEERIEDEIREMREGLIEKKRQFEEDWKQKKVELKAALDEAVKSEIRKGRSAQEILRELGSNNTVWIYKLRAEVMAEEGNGPAILKPVSAPKPVESTPPQQDSEQGEAVPEPEPDSTIEGIKWLHHDHEGVHRWLISEDYRYVKKHGVEGTPHEGKWFMVDVEGHFVAGDKALFESTPKREFSQRVQMLKDLLAGEFPFQKLKLSPNRWTS
jgi:hypothetical protein